MTRRWGAGEPRVPASREDDPYLSSYLNTRDIGGIRTSPGEETAPGTVFRTAAMGHALPDLVLNLAREIEQGSSANTREKVHFLDLRSPSEVNEKPAPRDTVTVHRIPLRDPDARHVPPPARGPEHFAQQYVRMLPDAGRAVATLLDIVAADTGPVVVGCRLGKDRTGLVILLLLRLLGVPDHDNREEFGRTGRALARRRDWLDGYAARRGETPAEVLRRCALPPGVPQHVLDVLRLRAARDTPAPALWPAVDAALLRRARARLTRPKGELA
ncbi:tyrosine-protein phosphatase (plasmid) [Streptomyces sp. HUAS MG91]|uniref:Tyrosine-protein phosphatase n=1 Tax=Streptomyces tabacisoli TaxID=3156398 RepID=A0AAU8J6Y1_9ACTN